MLLIDDRRVSFLLTRRTCLLYSRTPSIRQIIPQAAAAGSTSNRCHTPTNTEGKRADVS